MSLYVCMCACVFAPLHRCSALLAEGSGGELSLFKQMERDTPGLRKTQRTGNCRAGCLKHTHTCRTQTAISHVIEHQVADTRVLKNTT